MEHLIKSPYGQWTLKKSESLKKEQWDQKALNKLHGWISPEGEYHHMGPNDTHTDTIVDKHGLNGVYQAYNAGWISVGHGGYNAIASDRSVLQDSNHPAFKKMRSLVGKHWNTMNINGQDYDVDHFRRHGALKEATTEGFSMRSK